MTFNVGAPITIVLKTSISILFALLLIVPHALSAEPDSLKQLDYPELQTIPSASETLEAAAKRENSSRTFDYITYEIPGAITLVAGIMQMSSLKAFYTLKNTPIEQQDMSSAFFAVGSGAFWLAGGLTMSFVYQPYAKGSARVKKLPVDTLRKKLEKERAAEEELQTPALFFSRLKWFCIGNQLLAGAYVVANAKGGMPLILGVSSALSGLIPLVFTNPWESEFETYENYKKRIYKPMVSAGFLQDSSMPGQVSLHPGLILTARF